MPRRAITIITAGITIIIVNIAPIMAGIATKDGGMGTTIIAGTANRIFRTPEGSEQV